MNIKKVSEQTGISTDTIRYYERIGLIPPVTRNRAGVRDFTEVEIQLLEFVRCYRNAGGSASVTTYDKQILLKAVLDGDINPGRVFTETYSLDEINQAYQDMADRKTIKSMLIVND